MRTIRYIIKRIFALSPKKIIYNLEQAAKESGRSKLFLALDMLLCFFRYGAGYIDYRAYSFYNMPHRKRKTYFSRSGYRKFLFAVNDAVQKKYFYNKALFNDKFKSFLKRGSLDLSQASREELCRFLTVHGSRYFVKPAEGEGGKGIWVLELGDYSDVKSAADAVFGAKDCVIEEAIVQHPDLQSLNPDSVNGMRILTFVDDHRNAVPICAMQKIGFQGNITDNSSMYIRIDREKGITDSVGCNVLTNGDTDVFHTHPDYGYALCGLKVPYVKEAVELCLEAARKIPEVRFVGWDVAITEDGPALIEGNNFPAQWDYQYFLSREGKEGLKSILGQYTKLW